MALQTAISTDTLEKLRIIHARLEAAALVEEAGPNDEGWLGRVMQSVQTETMAAEIIKEFGSPQLFFKALAQFLIIKKIITKSPQIKKPAAPREPDFMDRMQGHVV